MHTVAVAPLVAAALVAVAIGGCHRQVRGVHDYGWLRVENAGAIVVAPHALEVGSPRGRLWRRTAGRWSLIAEGNSISEPVFFGENAIVHIQRGDDRHEVAVRREGRVTELDVAGDLRVDPGGASVSYLACADACRAVTVTMVRDPRQAPVRRRLALPADACREGMVAFDVRWTADQATSAVQLAVHCATAEWRACRRVAERAPGVLRTDGDC